MSLRSYNLSKAESEISLYTYLYLFWRHFKNGKPCVLPFYLFDTECYYCLSEIYKNRIIHVFVFKTILAHYVMFFQTITFR